MTEPLLPLWELVQTHQVVARSFRELFAAHGLTPNQFGVLACLADGDDFTKAQLARAVLVTPQSMDPLIDSLLARGLVRRDGPPGRGRAAGIGITPAGLDLLAVVRPRVAALNAPDAIGLPSEALPTFVEHLRAVRERLDGPDDAP